MASGFFAILDDVATLLDDVATMGKIATSSHKMSIQELDLFLFGMLHYFDTWFLEIVKIDFYIMHPYSIPAYYNLFYIYG